MAHTTGSLDRSMNLLAMSLFVFLLIHKGNAYTFRVGGGGDWKVPSDPNTNTYNQWAEKSRFQIGDTISFVYPADKDSVLLVTKEDFENCNTGSPLEKHSDGNTVFSFNHSGPFYFISGVQDNCKKNEKLVVVVMADRSGGQSSPPSPSPSQAPTRVASEVPLPSPSPAEAMPPPPSNSSEVPLPSPATPPAGEESPPPPGESSPAPSQESNPPKKRNGASSISIGFAGFFGALIGSSLILAF